MHIAPASALTAAMGWALPSQFLPTKDPNEERIRGTGGSLITVATAFHGQHQVVLASEVDTRSDVDCVSRPKGESPTITPVAGGTCVIADALRASFLRGNALRDYKMNWDFAIS
jgi:hypothetical protein